MKTWIVVPVVFLMTFTVQQSAEAQERTFGLGGSIGDPYGLSAKLWLSENTAIAAGLGFGIADEIGFFQLQADFLLHKPIDLDWDAGTLQFYYGGGLGLYSGSRWDVIYIRIPLGMSMNFLDAPLDIFLETVPYMEVDPDFYFSFTGAAGFRYYFGK
ncbi:MAG: hypothetical protein EA359_18790 [Balneolaceae bacterium]|nr:MAG: hypothetical protein EA359_18790 [Balneolaceae bacterium]